MKIIIDSNILIALKVKDERLNNKSKNIIKAFLEGKIKEIHITDYVLVETVNFLLKKTNFEATMEIYELLMKKANITYVNEVMLEKIDELFLNKLSEIIESCTNNFENYEYSKAKTDVEKFFWNMFADNYLEIVKKRIYNDKGSRRISAQYTLYKSLLTILKLIAPITPFVAEEIYQTHFKKFEKNKSIHLSDWPVAEKTSKTESLDLFLEILSRVRQAKTEAKKTVKKSPKKISKS